MLVIALGAAAILGLLVRVPSIAEPLGIDQGFWASAAHQLNLGRLPYQDVWDHKPPGTLLIYLAAFRTLGWHPASIAWAEIIAATSVTLLLFVLVRRLTGPLMAAAASAIYATMTVPGWLYRHDGFLERSVAEIYISVIVGVAAWFAIRLRERGRLRDGIGLGLLGGLALLFKPNAGIYLPALVAWVALLSPPAARPRVVTLSAIALAAAVFPLIALLWLWAIGVGDDARIALVQFNRAYVAEGFSIGGQALGFSKAVWLRMKTEPLWSAGGLGAVVVLWSVVRRRRVEPLPALAVAWGGSAAIAIFANGARLFNSYFIQALPPLAILSAWLIVGARRGSGLHKVAAAAAVVVTVLLLNTRNYATRVAEYARAGMAELGGEGDRTGYLNRFGGYANDRGYSARANEELTAYLRTRVRPRDRLYFFGINFSAIYFRTDTEMANRFLRTNIFVPSTFPHPGFSLPDVVAELERQPPVYLVFETLHSRSAMGVAVDALQQDPAVLGLLAKYDLEVRIEDFAVYRRRE